ncbi:Putative Holliday junction resolvase [Symmachiella dynata]|uniref:Putative pre-16S rRNA nuclease n=1 Tax=Symmachiella dynata TaxID=2527995 RepID=A0A517ZI95_9PLAN|nr:Holliday junction resolvase RuvX [Symmachiella dynata]QDU42204.1 Putative Holliday junction resolvase [Symmachiella dynata]
MTASSDPPTADTFPVEGRLLGIDFGTKRIGVAISTPEQTIASPLENYSRRTKPLDGEFLSKIANEYRVVGLVVGLPVHMSGDESEKSRQARNFGKWLSHLTKLPVRYWDERHTSLIAELYLHEADLSNKKRKARMDMVAAQIMLQNYLDSDDRTAAPQSL